MVHLQVKFVNISTYCVLYRVIWGRYMCMLKRYVMKRIYRFLVYHTCSSERIIIPCFLRDIEYSWYHRLNPAWHPTVWINMYSVHGHSETTHHLHINFHAWAPSQCQKAYMFVPDYWLLTKLRTSCLHPFNINWQGFLTLLFLPCKVNFLLSVETFTMFLIWTGLSDNSLHSISTALALLSTMSSYHVQLTNAVLHTGEDILRMCG